MSAIPKSVVAWGLNALSAEEVLTVAQRSAIHRYVYGVLVWCFEVVLCGVIL